MSLAAPPLLVAALATLLPTALSGFDVTSVTVQPRDV